ncbi:MAG: YqjK family protein [Leptothrix sp. (in: b-proteobacteria)]
MIDFLLPSRTDTLLRRRAALLQRSAELRGSLVATVHTFQTPLARADQAWALLQSLRNHRQELSLGLAAAVAVLALRRPRAALGAGWRWGRRLYSFWRTWRKTERWLRPLLARFL